jgi:hypothetical protein
MISDIIIKLLSGVMTFLFGPDKTHRRTIGGSVWHFSNRCKYWPTEHFEEIKQSPQFGVCPICEQIKIKDTEFSRTHSHS